MKQKQSQKIADAIVFTLCSESRSMSAGRKGSLPRPPSDEEIDGMFAAEEKDDRQKGTHTESQPHDN